MRQASPTHGPDPRDAGEGGHIVSVCLGHGPQGFVRHEALARAYGGRVTFLAMSAVAPDRAWRVATDGLSFDVVTLFDEPYDRVPPRTRASEVVRALGKLQPTAVVTLGYADTAMRAAAAWARRAGVVSLVYLSMGYHDRPRALWREWAKRWVVGRLYDGAFVGGARSADYAQSLGIPGDRIATGYEVVDNERFAQGAEAARARSAELRQALGLPERFFLYAGRLAPEKNLSTLLQAYALYRQQAPEGWGLAMVGSGGGEGKLRELADRLETPDVRWLEFRQPEEMPELYGLASCLVLPSLREPWGLVVNEALACSLPVIVSDRCGCVPELLRDGRNGFLWSPNDPQTLAALMGRMASADTDRRGMGEAGRQIIASFTPETWARSLLALIDRVAGLRGSCA